MECNQVVPLLSTSPDQLVLIVGRRPAPMFDETDEFFDIDEDGDEHQTPVVNDNSLWNMSMNSTIHENSNNNNNNVTATNSLSTTNANTYSLISSTKKSAV